MLLSFVALPGLTQTSDRVNQLLWYLLTGILAWTLQSSQTFPWNM